MPEDNKDESELKKTAEELADVSSETKEDEDLSGVLDEPQADSSSEFPPKGIAEEARPQKSNTLLLSTIFATMLIANQAVDRLMPVKEASPIQEGVSVAVRKLTEISPEMSNLVGAVEKLSSEVESIGISQRMAAESQVKIVAISEQVKLIGKMVQDLNGSVENHRSNAASQFRSLGGQVQDLQSTLEMLQADKSFSVKSEPIKTQDSGYRYKFTRKSGDAGNN